MVYGIIQLINFAHGEIFMVGAYGGLAMFTYVLPTAARQSVHRPAARCSSARILVAVVVAVTMERFAYRPLRNAPRLAPLITALGVSVSCRRRCAIFYPNAKSDLPFPEDLPRGQPDDPDRSTVSRSASRRSCSSWSSVGLALHAADSYIERTRMGRAMRATSQDPDIARLMGIDPDRVIVLTFILGAALAGVGGVLYGSYLNNINIDMGFQNGIFAFTAAVLGGIGNIRGAIIGGFVHRADQVPRRPVHSRWARRYDYVWIFVCSSGCWCSGRRACSVSRAGAGMIASPGSSSAAPPTVSRCASPAAC